MNLLASVMKAAVTHEKFHSQSDWKMINLMSTSLLAASGEMYHTSITVTFPTPVNHTLVI